MAVEKILLLAEQYLPKLFAALLPAIFGYYIGERRAEKRRIENINGFLKIEIDNLRHILEIQLKTIEDDRKSKESHIVIAYYLSMKGKYFRPVLDNYMDKIDILSKEEYFKELYEFALNLNMIETVQKQFLEHFPYNFDEQLRSCTDPYDTFSEMFNDPLHKHLADILIGGVELAYRYSSKLYEKL